jgi:GNAT superfamily N-acetyltransferase
VIRPAGPQDVRFLRDMLRHAYFWRIDESAELPVARYVTGWGREGDSGFVAIDELQPVGAAWYRLFPPREAGFGFVDERTPELTVAVVPSRRGKGIGHELMEALLAQARSEGYDALSLSSPSGSTALYERYGFRVVSDEGEAVTMRLAL